MSRSDGESGRGATGAIWVVICPPPPPSKPNGDGAGVACCWNPKGEGEGLAPNAGVEEGAPNAEVDNGVPKADSPPNAGAEDAAPNAGVDDGVPNAGVDDGVPNAGVPKAGVDDGVPKAGVDGVAPNAGVEEGVPKAGVVEGVPKAGVEDGVPKRGEEEGVPNMAAAAAEIAGGEGAIGFRGFFRGIERLERPSEGKKGRRNAKPWGPIRNSKYFEGRSGIRVKRGPGNLRCPFFLR